MAKLRLGSSNLRRLALRGDATLLGCFNKSHRIYGIRTIRTASSTTPNFNTAFSANAFAGEARGRQAEQVQRPLLRADLLESIVSQGDDGESVSGWLTKVCERPSLRTVQRRVPMSAQFQKAEWRTNPSGDSCRLALRKTSHALESPGQSSLRDTRQQSDVQAPSRQTRGYPARACP